MESDHFDKNKIRNYFERAVHQKSITNQRNATYIGVYFMFFFFFIGGELLQKIQNLILN